MTIQRIRQGNCTLLYNTALLVDVPDGFFDLAFWQRHGWITGQAQGRGITRFLQYGPLALVWRQYRRGGLIGKLLKRHFLYTGSNRAEQEFSLLLRLQEMQLPAPIAVAARIEHSGFFYQAELMTLRIPDAQDLVSLLQEKPLPDAQWFAIGQMIARFHRHNVFHADLNSHNILLDSENRCWLIDFDKCDIRRPGAWKAANLVRLRRSFDKEARLHSRFHFHDHHWQQLLQGYNSD